MAGVPDQSLGIFIRARRNKRGLTQQLLADAAHISKSYLVKIEAGRHGCPSEPVLAQLSAALDLDGDDEQTLYVLAGKPPRADWRPTSPNSTQKHLLYACLLDDSQSAQAMKMAVDAQLNLLEANTRFRSGFSGVDNHPTLADWHFLDPRARLVHEQWEREASSTVWWLRRELARNPKHDGLTAQIGRLSASSPDFRRLWADPTGDRPPAETMRIRDYQTREVITLISAYFLRQPSDDVYVWVGVPIDS
ncbi:helix-turn-helix transcriptional regulator [Prescottella agglutinans]|uniref:Transcriptional regulator with XRE-family HTH domain n=1 Tax=Prescottella agglutinans TaxID=1644129 RepID=A0ABT6MK06_9NOCA|nr:helix-turn-helix transcriptional regulator [Prescottella agglutinans]MDH6284656.1 transcriptional regulator with XRE-family HTH domain [Prescottella agglutinans]